MTRIYVVKETRGEGEYLIEAATQAEAIRIVTAGMYTAKPATPQDVARLYAEGVTLTKREQ